MKIEGLSCPDPQYDSNTFLALQTDAHNGSAENTWVIESWTMTEGSSDVIPIAYLETAFIFPLPEDSGTSTRQTQVMEQ